MTSATSTTTTGQEVAEMIYTAEKSKNPSKRSAATRALNSYVTQRAAERGCT